MVRLVSPSRTVMYLAALVHALASTRAQDPRLTERAYVVLEKQDLGERHTDITPGPLFCDVTWLCAFCPRTVTLCSVLAVLLLLMIVMAVCVYKPITRRWKPGRVENHNQAPLVLGHRGSRAGFQRGYPDQAKLHHQRAALPWVIRHLGVIGREWRQFVLVSGKKCALFCIFIFVFSPLHIVLQ